MQTFVRDITLAKALEVHRNTVWRWVREGRLPPPVRLSPGCSRWPSTVLEDLRKTVTSI